MCRRAPLVVVDVVTIATVVALVVALPPMAIVVAIALILIGRSTTSLVTLPSSADMDGRAFGSLGIYALLQDQPQLVQWYWCHRSHHEQP
jgi:hypothetical protein